MKTCKAITTDPIHDTGCMNVGRYHGYLGAVDCHTAHRAFKQVPIIRRKVYRQRIMTHTMSHHQLRRFVTPLALGKPQ